jgi:hypothetical protein
MVHPKCGLYVRSLAWQAINPNYMLLTKLAVINKFNRTLIIYIDFIICILNFNVYCNLISKCVLTFRILYLVTHCIELAVEILPEDGPLRAEICRSDSVLI